MGVSVARARLGQPDRVESPWIMVDRAAIVMCGVFARWRRIQDNADVQTCAGRNRNLDTCRALALQRGGSHPETTTPQTMPSPRSHSRPACLSREISAADVGRFRIVEPIAGPPHHQLAQPAWHRDRRNTAASSPARASRRLVRDTAYRWFSPAHYCGQWSSAVVARPAVGPQPDIRRSQCPQAKSSIPSHPSRDADARSNPRRNLRGTHTSLTRWR